MNSCDPGNQQTLCRHLFRENICCETLQLLPVLDRWALLRLMIVKYELYNVSEQLMAQLLQHVQFWHLFMYSQNGLKAALIWKPWGFCTGTSLGYRIGKLWTLPLITAGIIKLTRQTDLGQNGSQSLMANVSYEGQNNCVCYGCVDLPPPVPKKCSSTPGLACTIILHGRWT